MADLQILNAGYEERDDAFERAEGNYIHREDGKRFLDLALGAGGLIMGHADPDIVAAVSAKLPQGPFTCRTLLNPISWQKLWQILYQLYYPITYFVIRVVKLLSAPCAMHAQPLVKP